MDEPTLGLDIMIAQEIRELILKQAREEEKGILLTTHYISEAEELCDYIYVIDHGEMIAKGTKQELRELFVQDLSLEEILVRIIRKSREGEEHEEGAVNNESRDC